MRTPCRKQSDHSSPRSPATKHKRVLRQETTRIPIGLPCLQGMRRRYRPTLPLGRTACHRCRQRNLLLLCLLLPGIPQSPIMVDQECQSWQTSIHQRQKSRAQRYRATRKKPRMQLNVNRGMQNVKGGRAVLLLLLLRLSRGMRNVKGGRAVLVLLLLRLNPEATS